MYFLKYVLQKTDFTVDLKHLLQHLSPFYQIRDHLCNLISTEHMFEYYCSGTKLNQLIAIC